MIELSGGVIGGAISGIIIATVNYFTSSHKMRLDKAKKIIVQLCNQVEAYYEVVNLYAEKVHSLDEDEGKPSTILVRMRNAIEENGFSRPDMTSRKARDTKKPWE